MLYRFAQLVIGTVLAAWIASLVLTWFVRGWMCP